MQPHEEAFSIICARLSARYFAHLECSAWCRAAPISGISLLGKFAGRSFHSAHSFRSAIVSWSKNGLSLTSFARSVFRKKPNLAVGTRVTSRPPAQNRTCGFPAYGSHLGSNRQ